MGRSCQILGKDKWKNKDKTGKNAQFPRALEGNFHHLSLNGANTAHSTILTPNTLSDFKIEPENKKKLCFFKQILKHYLNFEPLPLPISGLNLKFDYDTLYVPNRSLLSQNLVFKSYLYQTLSRKLFGGSSRPPPPH